MSDIENVSSVSSRVSSGETIIQIDFEDDEGYPRRHEIPVSALASWRELLGFSNNSDTLDAIIQVGREGEPPIDFETGDNVWTKPFAALQRREQDLARQKINPVTRVQTLSRMSSNVSDTISEVQREARVALGVEKPAQRQLRVAARSFSSDPLDFLKQSLDAGDLGEQIEISRQAFLGELRPDTSSIDSLPEEVPEWL